jgi:hypothetical protein
MISQGFAKKKEAEQEKNGWLFRLFPIYIGQKRNIFRCVRWLSNVWKRRYWSRLQIHKTLAWRCSFVMRAYTNLRNIEDAAHYQRGVSKQNETNRF